jgi:hypothetical protein
MADAIQNTVAKGSELPVRNSNHVFPLEESAIQSMFMLKWCQRQYKSSKQHPMNHHGWSGLKIL